MCGVEKRSSSSSSSCVVVVVFLCVCEREWLVGWLRVDMCVLVVVFGWLVGWMVG